MSNAGKIDVVGMSYLESVPRKAITVYLPLLVFLIVLLFPFYWMAITSVKPEAELLSREGNPFWVIGPTLAHFHKLLFDTAYPEWLWNTVLVSVVSTFFSLAGQERGPWPLPSLPSNLGSRGRCALISSCVGACVAVR